MKSRYLFNLLRANSSLHVYTNDPHRVSTSGNYYIAGVVFMIAVIILLLYVNLYHDNCLTDTCEDISKLPVCSCIKCFLVYEEESLSGNQQSQEPSKSIGIEKSLQTSYIPQAALSLMRLKNGIERTVQLQLIPAFEMSSLLKLIEFIVYSYKDKKPFKC
ncbi:hypothetical protein BpHYR1_001370 [Brachionus plicatilis]|uniref:Uncharacterized protein n=1 Tax=Brachionus plicatilis TaxID=10195 RepID=A0A3M7P345_BRAPC|nr:hypothetical protein BpHYR1_001370 [Brachionus plicatilis]